MKIIDNMYYTDTHVYFWRNKTPFSNFYRRHFTYKGYALQFSEQGFMMEKAFLFDPSKVDAIARVTQPDKAKALGRAVQNYDDAVWSSVRYDKMVDVLRAKFLEELHTGESISCVLPLDVEPLIFGDTKRSFEAVIAELREQYGEYLVNDFPFEKHLVKFEVIETGEVD